MRKFYFIIIIIFCFICGINRPGQAQQRPVYSQYMFNSLLINPAYAGNQKQLSATLLMRNQWVNLEGAPSTQALSVHSNIEKKNVGVGFTAYNEQIGVHSDFGIYASYAYQIKFKNSQLSMGLQAGFNRLSSDFFKLTLKSFSDPLLGRYNKFNPNFGAGAFYSTRTAYVGFSVPYLIHNRVIKETESGVVSEAREARYYFVHTGKVFELSKDVQVKPSILLRLQEGAPMGADLNLNFFLQNTINVGVSYRSGDSMIMLFELIMNENLSFGYAYDVVTSGLNRYTRGSHELMLNYRIQLSPTPCHSYF